VLVGGQNVVAPDGHDINCDRVFFLFELDSGARQTALHRLAANERINRLASHFLACCCCC